MTSKPVARVGDQVEGICNIHGPVIGEWTQGSPKVNADGLPIIRLGDIGIASCGHTFTAVTASEVFTADGIPVHRVDDHILLEPGGDGITVNGSPTVNSL